MRHEESSRGSERRARRSALMGIGVLSAIALRIGFLAFSPQATRASPDPLAWTGVAELPRLDDAQRERSADPEAWTLLLAVDGQGLVTISEMGRRMDLADPEGRKGLQQVLLLASNGPSVVHRDPDAAPITPTLYASAEAPADSVLRVLRECLRTGGMPRARMAVQPSLSATRTLEHELVPLRLDDLPEMAGVDRWRELLPLLVD